MLKSIPPEEKKTYVTLYKTNGYSYTMTLLAIIAEFVNGHHEYLRAVSGIYLCSEDQCVQFAMGRDHTGRWGVLPCEAVLDRAGISPALCTRDDSACFQPDRIRSLNHRRSDRHSQGEKTPGPPAEARAYLFMKLEACRANGKNSIQKR